MRLWDGQTFPPAALATRGGQPLRVVHRGRPGSGPGPDFRDAVIVAPWGLLEGDVELHVRASDFRRHGHHLDHAYDNLALHLVFWDDEGRDTPLACGRTVPVVALAPWAERRAQEIREWLERSPAWREPCLDAVERLGPAAVAAVLGRWGDVRFRRKCVAFRRGLRREVGDELLWRGLLEALGYGGNRKAFRLLADRVPWGRLRRALAPLPLAERPRAARRLLWLAGGPMEGAAGLPWRTSGMRPGNRPQPRLEGAAHLAARFASTGLAEGLMSLVGEAAGRGLRVLRGALTVRGLIGPSRAGEVLANVVLPYAAVAGDAAVARGLYRALPLPSRYGAVRHLHRAVGGRLRVGAREQQGMLYLLGRYCRQGGCGRCPLS